MLAQLALSVAQGPVVVARMEVVVAQAALVAERRAHLVKKWQHLAVRRSETFAQLNLSANHYELTLYQVLLTQG